MNADHIVGVWVLGDRNEKDRFATGYAVAADRILTVAHILKPNASKILVRFVHCDGAPVEEATVVWNGRETDENGLDALVLECRFPDSVQPSVDLFTEPPEEPVQWYSNCFPAFARDGGKPKEYLDARGQFNPPPDGASFPVECDEKQPVPVAWGGASGGPVLVGSRRLAGIISGVRLGKETKNEKGEPVAPFQRLTAVPAWKLTAIPEFLASLGGVSSDELSESEEAWRKQLATRIRIELSAIDEPGVSERFEYHLGRPLPDDQKEVDALSRELVDDPDLVDKISAIRRDCLQRGLKKAADQLAEVEDHMLPRLFPLEERRRFWDALRFGGSILVERAVTCATAAEGRMAQFNARRVHFVWNTPQDDATQLQAPAMLRLGKVQPGDLSESEIALRILLELAGQRLEADHLTVTEKARDEILSGKVATETRESALADAKQLAARLGARLRTRESAYGTAYCVIRVHDTGLSRETLRSALGVLRGWLPDLDFLEITHDCPNGHYEDPILELLSRRVKDDIL